MQGHPSTRQIALLGALTLVLAVGIMIYAISVIRSLGGSESVALEGELVNEVQVVTSNDADTSSWQQELTEYEVEIVPEPVLPELVETEELVVPPEPALLSEPAESQTPPPSDVKTEASSEVAVVVEPEPVTLPYQSVSAAADCGEVVLPESLFGQLAFLSSAAENPVFICIGEAVGAGCNAAAFAVFNGTFYVVETDDGLCRLGTQNAENSATLCEFETILEASGDEDLSWPEWQARFTADPGGTMATFINNNVFALSNINAGAVGCADYRI